MESSPTWLHIGSIELPGAGTSSLLPSFRPTQHRTPGMVLWLRAKTLLNLVDHRQTVDVHEGNATCLQSRPVMFAFMFVNF